MLDLRILEVFSNLNDSMILICAYKGKRKKKKKSKSSKPDDTIFFPFFLRRHFAFYDTCVDTQLKSTVRLSLDGKVLST